MKKMMMPSMKNEVLLDLNADGKLDFAFIDTTADGTPDTFAIDMTGDGSLDLYYSDRDGNGIADTIEYYPDGVYQPSYTKIDKNNETNIQELCKDIGPAFRANDAKALVEALNGIKQTITDKTKVYVRQGTLSGLRNRLLSDPEAAKLLMTSPKNELFFDLNGDGIADFALADTDHDNNIDTLGIDLTSDGEFDLYLTDHGNDFIPEHVDYYASDADHVTKGGHSQRLEDTLRPAAEHFAASMRADLSAQGVIKALNTYKEEAIAAMRELNARVNGNK